MNFSKISYEQVISLAEELQNSATSMQLILDEVRVLFNKVGNDNVWAGTAAATSKATFDTLSRRFPEFYEVTSKCHDHLVSVVNNYKNVDSAVTRG